MEDLSGKMQYDTGIIASTANSRMDLYKRRGDPGCRNVLVEKPVGQSLEDGESFKNGIERFDAAAFVNLNMRLYDGFIELKKDLAALPQLQGFKTITINTGTIGIGANGIHYLDLLYCLLDADHAEIACAHIDDPPFPAEEALASVISVVGA
jgi:predicted dehydrogenase